MKAKSMNEMLDSTDVINKRNIILKILLDYTRIESIYVGGGPEPEIIVFKGSEDKNKKLYLSKIAEIIALKIK